MSESPKSYNYTIMNADTEPHYSFKNAFSFKKNSQLILFSRDATGDYIHRPLDGLRAVSVIWIIISHFYFSIQVVFPDSPVFSSVIENTPRWLNFFWHGAYAVDQFFVLSGFLIGGALMREYESYGKIRVKRFYISRFLRLMPAYILALAIFSPFLPNFEYVWANLLHVMNYLPHEKMYLSWGWSLAVEEQFYFILPVFLLFVFFPSNNKVTWLIGLIILSSLVRYYVQHLNPELESIHPANFMFASYTDFSTSYFNNLYAGFHVRFGPLFIGVLGAYLFNYKSEQLTVFFSHWSAGILFCLALVYLLYAMNASYFDIRVSISSTYMTYLNVFSYNIFSFAILLLMLSCLYRNWASKPVSWFLSLRIWYPIAQMSYIMYLFHMLFVILACYQMAAVVDANPDILIDSRLTYDVTFQYALYALLATIAFSFLVCLLVERPFMNFRRMKWFTKIEADS